MSLTQSDLIVFWKQGWTQLKKIFSQPQLAILKTRIRNPQVKKNTQYGDISGNLGI